MNPARKWSGLRFSVGQAMLAIVVIAVSLAPLVEAVKLPTPERIALAIGINLFVTPFLINMFLSSMIKNEAMRDRTTSVVWIVLVICAYVIPFLIFLGLVVLGILRLYRSLL
jgi:hypothetical protein